MLFAVFSFRNQWLDYFQGASKNGKTPDGTPYIDAAEKEEIKELLT